MECVKCRTEQGPSQFPKDNSRPSGRHPYCKICHRERYASLPKTPEFKAKVAANSRKHALKKYGITSSEYTLMLDRQMGSCAICFDRNKSGNELSVDHCHKTGMVRGLLCNRCNWAIGKFEDNTVLLLSAVEYLNETKDSSG